MNTEVYARDSRESSRGRTPLNWTDVVLALVGGVVLIFALSLAVVYATGETSITGAALLGLLMGYTVAYLLISWLLLRRRRSTWAEIGMRAVSGRMLALAVAFGLAVRGLTVLTLTALERAGVDLGDPQADLIDLASGSAVMLVGVLAVAGVLVPIAEEIFFRGVVFLGLRSHLGVWPAALLSASAFGLAHGINVVLPVTFVLGVVNALLLERSRSLWPPILVHMTNNVLALVTAAVIL